MYVLNAQFKTREKNKMKKIKRFLVHRDWLIHRVTKVEPVLDELLIQGVIQQESYDNIRALPTSEDKMRKLFDCLLTAGGGTGKDIFYNTLEKLEPDLISCIKTKSRGESE
uniref:CARD domain-containing protein n=1 Tax=Lates calcarifer TaxID=8187 RepID=A0A4W6E7S1_LATCA